MTEEAMLKEMFLKELSQADLKAVGRSRAFDKETIASRELLRHVFLSEQGVASALTSLTETEIFGLHLLNCVGGEVELDIFKRVYPGSVTSDYYSSYTQQYKGLFQKIKAQLVRRGILLVGTLRAGLSRDAVLERRRFLFPKAFSPFLPLPFLTHRADPAVTVQHRRDVLRNKIMEILQKPDEPKNAVKSEKGRWHLANGELLFEGRPFRVEQLKDWPLAQVKASVPYIAKRQPETLQAVPLLFYALSRLGEEDWLAADSLLPFWKKALPSPQAPEPQVVCEAAYQWGCIEKAEQEGTSLYRLPRSTDAEANAQPETFLNIQNPKQVGVCLQRISLEALERLCEVSRLEISNGELWATPSLVKISHAPAEIMADPMIGWLREHKAFRSTFETVKERKGKLIVHENLLLARVSDLSLKTMLEKNFSGPGQLVALSSEFVAFPTGLLSKIQSWMKKSGHLIKSHQAPEPAAKTSEI